MGSSPTSAVFCPPQPLVDELPVIQLKIPLQQECEGVKRHIEHPIGN